LRSDMRHPVKSNAQHRPSSGELASHPNYSDDAHSFFTDLRAGI
jgi:hypothetical protein